VDQVPGYLGRFLNYDLSRHADLQVTECTPTSRLPNKARYLDRRL
jgi:hypothetical protein